MSGMLPFEDMASGGCAECGYAWTTSLEDVKVIVSAAPERVAALLGQGDPRRRPSRDTWSPSAYVWHMVDVLRIAAERIWAVSRDPDVALVAWDENELARVRSYERLSTAAALWALGRAVEDWLVSLAAADPATPYVHPELGTGTIELAARRVGHEIHHHEGDLRRGLGI